MRLFWVTYISAAVAGSAAVWFAAPLARPFMSGFFRKKEPVAAERIDPMLRNNRVVSGSEFKHSSETGETGPERVGTDDKAPGDDPPALLGIFKVSGQEKPSWGVVKVKTSLYDTEGKRLGDIPAGLVIDFIESRKSSKGAMVLCKFKFKGKEHGPYLVKRSELSLYTGNYTSLSERQRTNLENYFKTMGLMEERKIEVMQQIAMKNPHYAQYKAAYDKYMEHIETARELTEQRDKATGLQRSSLDDRLRRMKNEEVALQMAYEDIHQKYKAWKKDNAASLPDSAADPKVQEYRAEMRRIAKALPGLAY